MTVVDASTVLAWLLPYEASADVERLLSESRRGGLCAPAIFALETANGLRTKIRQRRITAEFRDLALDRLDELGVELDAQVWPLGRLRSVVALSDRHGLTVYDASYLELAVRLDAAVATLDRDLAAAATAEGLEVLTT